MLSEVISGCSYYCQANCTVASETFPFTIPYSDGFCCMLRSALFWDVTVIPYRRFGTVYRSYIQGSSSPKTLKIGPMVSFRNVGMKLPIYSAEHARRFQISFTSQR